MTPRQLKNLTFTIFSLAFGLTAAESVVTKPTPPKPRLWSLQAVAKPDLPVGFSSFTNPIDAFVAAKYKEKGLVPVGRADKLTLLRRVYFDLIGLPPSEADQDAFLKDQSPDAYEKVVDRLLADEQHGVRWTRHWMDVLRYADLDGLDGSIMPAASGIHLWRDWMITALNSDIPYDQFVRAQILGNRSREHTVVTAGGQRAKTEGSPDDQFALGFLARAAITRDDKTRDIALSATETVSTAFMGMTVGCAKCHDHKFDPIKQTDFYSMKALFDPLVLKQVNLATPAQIFENSQQVERYKKAKEPIDHQVEALIGPYRTKLYEERVALLTPDVQAIIRKTEKNRTEAEQKIADNYYPVLRIDPSKIKEVMTPADLERYKQLQEQDGALKAPPRLPSYWTVEEDPVKLTQKSYVLTTGDPEKPELDKPVPPGFPFATEPVDFREGRREGFIDWLTAPGNPLFARVAVNRMWQWHFGEGLQRVPSDFGLLGGKPSNQALLDYLASEFVAHDYSMKWLHRLIVTSNTYQLDSKASRAQAAQSIKADPNDLYLWHFHLRRLEAEPLWDSILAESGTLDPAIGGKSFLLTIPDKKQSIFLPRDEVFDSRTNRRGIYIARGYVPSTDVMSNFLLSFDVDDGRTPCPIRGQTVTAPQALFAMNDKMIEAASARIADRFLKESMGNLPLTVNMMYRATLGRKPTPVEHDKALTFIANNPQKVKEFAWLLFNLDEFIYVR